MPKERKPRIRLLSLGGTWAARRLPGEKMVPDGPLGPFRPAACFSQPRVQTYRAAPRFLTWVTCEKCKIEHLPAPKEPTSETKEPLTAEPRTLFDDQIENLCRLDGFGLDNIDSSDMGPTHWEKTARFILDEKDKFDGWVVATGTDTLGSLAAALAFALRRLGKPVILTGAQKPRCDAGSDAPANLMNAIKVAAHGAIAGRGAWEPTLKEVAVVFGSRIIRATRCRKFSERDLEAFASINVPDLGRVRLDIDIDRNMRLDRPERGKKYWPHSPPTRFDAEVGLLHLYPGMPASALEKFADLCRAIVLAGFGAGNAPAGSAEGMRPLTPTIEILTKKKGVAVFMTTQCVLGSAEFAEPDKVYEVGDAAKKAGAYMLNDMLPEVAVVKARWLLSNNFGCIYPNGRLNLGRLQDLMRRPIAGEISKNKKAEKIGS